MLYLHGPLPSCQLFKIIIQCFAYSELLHFEFEFLLKTTWRVLIAISLSLDKLMYDKKEQKNEANAHVLSIVYGIVLL